MDEGDDATRSDDVVRHVAFVRRLARALVRDESAADDLTQETLVAAMRSPPRAGFSSRAWLAGIARRLAWRTRRGEERRLERERAQPRPSDAVAASETAAILELTQLVVVELHRLGEPYATTLRLRFFDGLDAAAIAARDHVPVETVRTRVKRGLAQMRERLDARHGGRRNAWAATLLGAPVVAMKVKLAVAALVVVAVGGGWWIARGDAVSRRSRDGVRVGADAPVVAELDAKRGAGVATSDPTRAAVAAKLDAAPAPFGVVLHGRLVDPRGGVADSGWLNLLADDPTFEPPTTVRLDASGTFAFGGLAEGIVTLRVHEAEGFEPQSWRVRLAAAPSVQQVDLVLTPSRLVPVRFVTPEGRRWGDVLGADQESCTWRRLSLHASSTPSRPLLAPNSDASSWSNAANVYVRRSKHGLFGSNASRLEIPDDVDGMVALPSLPIHVGAYFKHVLLRDVVVDSEEAGARFVIDPRDVEACLATVTVRFVDAATKLPLTRSHVELSDRQSSGDPRATTDATGLLQMERVPPGMLLFTRHEDDHEPYETFVDVEPRATLDLGTIALSERVDAKVHVVDEAGKAWRADVQRFALDRIEPRARLDSPESFGTDANGWGPIALGRRRWLLLASVWDGNASRLQSDAVVVDATSGAPAPIEIVVHPTTSGRVEVRDETDEFVVVRVADATGLPVRGWTFGRSAAWNERLPRGAYRFTMRDWFGRETSTSVQVGDRPFHAVLSFDAPPPVLDEPLIAQPSRETVAAANVVADSSRSTQSPKASPLRKSSSASVVLLHGALLDADGTSVQEKYVSAVDGDGRVHAGGPVPEGGYAIAGLPAGECDLAITADGFAEWHEHLVVDGGAAVLRHDVVLKRLLRIPVHFVTSDGKPLTPSSVASLNSDGRGNGPLTILVSREPLAGGAPPHWSTQRATEFGRFVRSNAPDSFDGTLELQGELPLVANVVLERKLLESRTIDSAVPSLEFRVDPETIRDAHATIRWRVVDALTAAPLELDEVMIGRSTGESGPRANQFRQPDGSYLLRDLEPGEGSLAFVAPGHETTRCRLSIAPGATIDLGVVALAPSAKLTGRLLGPDGKPVRVDVEAVVIDRTLPPPFFGHESFFGGECDGDLSLTVGRRRMVVSVTDDRFAWQSRVVDATAGDVGDVDFELVEGTKVSVRVPADRSRWFRVEVHDEQDQFVGVRGVVGGDRLRFHLSAGKYRALILENGETVATRELAVGSEPVALEIAPR